MLLTAGIAGLIVQDVEVGLDGSRCDMGWRGLEAWVNKQQVFMLKC